MQNTRSTLPRFLFIAYSAFLIIWALPESVLSQDGKPDAPYVPSPDTVVEKMLEMADLQPGDYLIDLGSGDGRIPIAAAKRGAYAHGIEIDTSLVRKARQNAAEAGVQDRVVFVLGDLFKQDISRANIITMYLFPDLIKKLRPTLLSLDPGTRIVSHLFRMGDWEADRHFVYTPNIFINQHPELQTNSITSINNLLSLSEDAPNHLFPEHDVYLWIVPARAEGTWSWSAESKAFTANIKQKYQEISLRAKSRDHSLEVSNPVLHGRRISFTISHGEITHNYSGNIKGDTIEGQVQIHRPNSSSVHSWKAMRK